MRLLLDTHIFLWSDDEPERIAPSLLAALADEASELALSIASIWEIQIKKQTGKLTLRLPLRDLITEYQQANGLQLLSIEFSHILALDGLPPHHKDPFDRVIIAQAITEDMTVVTADPKFSAYPVKLLI